MTSTSSLNTQYAYVKLLGQTRKKVYTLTVCSTQTITSDYYVTIINIILYVSSDLSMSLDLFRF